MSILNDQDIRKALIGFLTNKQPKPKKVLEELRVHNSNAIADVVTIHQSLHCYEIKGDNDSINRALQQAIYYNKSFPKITLVTTKKYEKLALKKLPHFWGIIICKHTSNSIVLSYLRKATNNPLIEKKSALLSLWKSELEEFAKELSITDLKKNQNRDIFASKISEVITLDKLKKGMSQKISNRIIKTDWS